MAFTHKSSSLYDNWLYYGNESHTLKGLCFLLRLGWLLSRCAHFILSLYLQEEWKTVWILIRWLRQKQAGMDLQCFQKRIHPDSEGQGLVNYQCKVWHVASMTCECKHLQLCFFVSNFLDFFPIFRANAGLQIRVHNWKLFFLFLNQNICCGYSKEPSQWDGSFEHPKHMLKMMDKKEIITILHSKIMLNWTYG